MTRRTAEWTLQSRSLKEGHIMNSACSPHPQTALARASLFLAMMVAAIACLAQIAGVVMAQEGEVPQTEFATFDRNKFSRSTNVDNKWFPLKPGMQYVYMGFTTEDTKRVPHRFVMIVTDLTKVIDGVRTVVVWDVDFRNGNLAETELAFFAQDDDGNVWLMGEYPEEYEDGKIAKVPAWLAGIRNSKAGLAMPAEPERQRAAYAQGWAPAVNWTDRAKVDQMGQKDCVPAGCYEDVLVIAESSTEEGPEAEQLKYYAPGVGLARVGWRGKGERLQENLELVEFRQLSSEAIANARAKALELEQRAYKISKKVYGRTPPAEHIPGTKRQ